MEHNKRRRGFFWRLPLRRKIGVLALGIVLLMLSTGVVSILLVTRSTHTMQNILNDNQLSYNLQQAVADEAHAFRTLIQAPGVEARQAFEEAAAETARCLAEIPFDYELTGEARYEITWTIRSSYETYCSRRDAVLAMDPAADGYIDALYDVYAMQEGSDMVHALSASAADTLTSLLEAEWTAVPEDSGE